MKSNILPLIALSVVFAMNAHAQNSNAVVTEPRTSKPYHHLQIKGEMNIKLVESDMPGLVVRGNPYQLGNTVTMLKNDTLFIYQANTRKTDSKTFLSINVSELVSLEVSGKTRVNCTGLVNTDYLTIRAYSGAQIKLDVRALKVDSRAMGCGYIDLSGSTVSNAESIDECSVIDSRMMDVVDKKDVVNYLCFLCRR
jgi:hypothetical protein